MSTKRLLCVDDDPDILKQRKLLLEASGYSVVSAGSGKEGLELLAKGPQPDLVLLDYMMPEMRGDDLARRIRENYPHIPLLVISAVDPLPDAFLKLIDGSVLKGQEPQVLISQIGEILNKKDTSDAANQRTVLCVEDEELQLMARKLLFESAGYRVLTARSFREAMEAFSATPVDAVVMDYWLSDQDGNGTALAEKMKRLRPLTPIVMLSGFTALPGEGALLDSWMRKAQIEPEKLVGEVDRLIKLRDLRQQDSKTP